VAGVVALDPPSGSISIFPCEGETCSSSDARDKPSVELTPTVVPPAGEFARSRHASRRRFGAQLYLAAERIRQGRSREVSVRRRTQSRDGDRVPHWMPAEQAGGGAPGGARGVRVERPDTEGGVEGSMDGRRVGSLGEADCPIFTGRRPVLTSSFDRSRLTFDIEKGT